MTAKPVLDPGVAQPARLPVGGEIDRGTPIPFTFEGKKYFGAAGDSLASALLANRVNLVARSFKYHRPRGVFSAGSEEPNALVTLGEGACREPNCKATTIELHSGLHASAQHGWPGVGFDLGAVNSVIAPFIPAGFYYKTFMWPPAFWERVYEPIIRQAAGLGRASTRPDPDRYDLCHEFCDLLIVGAGPAGLAAAVAAGRTGARVMVCDEDFAMGGRLICETFAIGGQSGADWARQSIAELHGMPNVRMCSRTAVTGAYDGATYMAVQKTPETGPGTGASHFAQKLWIIVPRRVIVATGATQRPLVFGGNDRPGVMLASAVRTYINRFAVAPGRRAAIFTCCDDGWRTLADLEAAGVEVVAIVDARPRVRDEILSLADKSAARVLTGSQVIATRGWKQLRQISVASGQAETIRFDVDLLAVAGGWSPNIALTTHLGAKPVWHPDICAFLPADGPEHLQVAGAAAGRFSLGEALEDGVAAASAATDGAARLELGETGVESTGVSPLALVPGSVGKAFVDLQNDVTSADMDLAWREGFRNAEHIKRYTTLGMGTDQGRTANENGLAIIARANNEPIERTGTVTGRPPCVPVRLGVLAGFHRGKEFRPTRRPAAHDIAGALGAKFVAAGQWLRPQWYVRDGETDWLQTVTREARAVRRSVGVCDVSTLGKIDVQGRDAVEFLNRIYINNIAGVAVGKTRYAVMLREDGFILDDGTVARFAQDHFVLSTTTANAVKVMQHLDFCHQVLWPGLDVQMVSVTEQWSQYAVAGPNSREVLTALVADHLDLADQKFPFMACAEFELAGVPARAFRISFSGERAYEIAVPARHGAAIFQRLLDLGRDYDITPYGIEALAVLRVEKGHASGPELTGHTTARDLGLGAMMSTKKDYVGRVMAGRPALVDESRPALVGLVPKNRDDKFRSGAHVLTVGEAPGPAADLGHISSVVFSPHMGSWIGLGLVGGGMARKGEILRAYDPVRGMDTLVEVVSPVFVDPKGARLRG